MLWKQNVEVVQYYNAEQDKFLVLPESKVLKRQGNSYISHTETAAEAARRDDVIIDDFDVIWEIVASQLYDYHVASLWPQRIL
jgi:hypothetical protein